MGKLTPKRSVPSKFMSDIEYSVITSDVIKSFDCNFVIMTVCNVVMEVITFPVNL